VNRIDFQTLADNRIHEALALMSVNPSWPSGVYYLAGYAVECALKAVICKKFREHDWPDKKFVSDCHTHGILELVRHADLKSDLDAAAAANRTLADFLGVVKDWNERSRYERRTEAEATKLIAAITDPVNGVLQWIKAHW